MLKRENSFIMKNVDGVSSWLKLRKSGILTGRKSNFHDAVTSDKSTATSAIGIIIWGTIVYDE